MDIQQAAQQLKKAGYIFEVAFQSPNQFCKPDWCVFASDGQKNIGLLEFGRENVEKLLTKMAQAANVQLR